MSTEIKDEFERLYAAARDASFRGQTGHTIDFLKRMIKLAEGHEELLQSEMYEHAHRNLALSYHDLNQHWKAVEHFRRAIELGTEVDGPFYRQYGHSLFLNDNFEQAIEIIKKAVEFDAEYDEAHYYLGLAYAMAGKRAQDRGRQLQYKRLAQEQCNRIKDIAPLFGGILQGQIDGI
jgi:tetratricopeptide (TPR) repeat protein